MAMANGETGTGPLRAGTGSQRGDVASSGGGGAAGTAAAGTAAGENPTPFLLLILFMVAMILPVSFDVGIRLSPIRVFLLAAFAPIMIYAVSGRIGRWRAADYTVVVFGLWMVATMFVNEGAEKLPYGTVLALELVGGYFLGRLMVRSAADWKRVVKLHLWMMAIMAPFAAVELFTGIQLWAIALDQIGDVVWRGTSSRPRMGMERVLAGFEHPILFGLFCSMTASSIFYIWRDRIWPALAGLGFVTAMTFGSLSSGPLLSLMIQASLAGWNEVTKGRWKLLAWSFGAVWVLLSLLSNRGPLILFIEKMTFSPHNAWMRVNQWTFAWAEVERNPIFGIGLGEWAHPYWMSDSIDAFWLATALRYGLLGLVMLLVAYFFMARAVFSAKPLAPLDARYRIGWGIGLIGAMFTLTTVHIWDAISVFVMFYLGAGGWYVDAAGRTETSDEAAAAPEDTAGTRYRRNLGPRHSRGPGRGAGGAVPALAVAAEGPGAADPQPPVTPGPDRPARQRARSRPSPETRAEIRRLPSHRRP